MTSKNRRRRYIRWRIGGVMRENRKVVQTSEDSVNFYCCSWFLTFDRPFLKQLYFPDSLYTCLPNIPLCSHFIFYPSLYLISYLMRYQNDSQQRTVARTIRPFKQPASEHHKRFN